MTKKILLGGLVGSVVVFVVSALVHLGPLGMVGIQTLPNEDAVMSAMSASIHDAGFYFFPGMPPGGDQNAYAQMLKTHPNGILVYLPPGTELNFGKLLGMQFLVGLVASFVLAWMLLLVVDATYGKRVLFVVAVALFAGIVYDVPSWIWYGFPASYTIMHIAGWTVSWTAAGLAMAAIIKRPQAA